MPNQEIIRKINEQIEDNKRKQNLFVDAEKDPILQGLIGQLKQGLITAQELQDYIDTGKLPEDKATGGRVGYATAGQDVPGEMPRTSQADVIQSMSFED